MLSHHVKLVPPHRAFHVACFFTYCHAEKGQTTSGWVYHVHILLNKYNTEAERWKGQSSVKVVSSHLSLTRSLRVTLIKCSIDGLGGCQMDELWWNLWTDRQNTSVMMALGSLSCQNFLMAMTPKSGLWLKMWETSHLFSTTGSTRSAWDELSGKKIKLE